MKIVNNLLSKPPLLVEREDFLSVKDKLEYGPDILKWMLNVEVILV